jgi:NitT/TauT family transport system permease protein
MRLSRLGILRGVIPLVFLLVIWQLVADPDSPTLPPPSKWWDALKAIQDSGALWDGLKESMKLFVEGLVVATLLGVGLGIALGASRTLNRALNPLLELLRTTPAAAIVPAAILLFGATTGTGVGVVVFGSFWPILLNVASGRATIPSLRMDLADTLHLSWWDRMRKIVLPSLVPQIAVGIRVAAPICFILVLLVDFLLATGGLGMMLVQFQQGFDAPSAFAMLAVIGVVGCLINLVIGLGERLTLRRWPRAAGD